MQEPILLTGFGPFGEHSTNPSQDAVQALAGESYEGFRIRSLVLPVQFERARAALEEALSAEPVAAVISCGIYAALQGPVRLELSARNRLDYTIPDVDGNLLQDRQIEPRGPALVYGTLPVAGIKQRLDRAGIACSLSEDAGGYLCNAVYYWLACRLGEERTPVGFLHLPYGAPARAHNVAALRLAVEETARRLAAQRVEATA
ncbi:MAG: pyroglutamyl-peptidase I [Planctomycetota bacterium]